jgi:hypothetical protein
MKFRIPMTTWLVGFLWLLLFASVVHAQHMIAGEQEVEGFDKLTWGATVEQANKIYPDLHFDSYQVVRRKEEPSEIYRRDTEPGKIDNVVFDIVEYWFKEKKLYKIRAVLHSRIGPRTLVTKAEESYDRLNEYLRHKHGEPKGDRAHYITDYLAVVREVTWKAGDTSILLIYKGPEQEYEDRLILEMEKQGR